MEKSKEILKVKNLKKYFVNRGFVNKAVDDLTFNLKAGEILGIIGESGSGKTTVGRTLIRLYEDYNGFITLNDKIISGKKLTKAREKFLRRSIQMIFQDPHASLNGQKTVYSILEEPLIVNGMIKDRINDLLQDWKIIKTNFRYSFEKEYKKLKLSNLKAINETAILFFKKYHKMINELEIESGADIKQNVEILLSYLEKKQEMESFIVDKIYTNFDNMLKIYFKYQQDYRNNNVDVDEIELKKAINNYENVKALRKITEKGHLLETKLGNKIKEKNDKISEINELILNNKNAFNNYINEFESELRLKEISKGLTHNLDEFALLEKNILLIKKSHTLIKAISKELRYLTIDQITELVDNIKLYNAEFTEKELNFSFVLKHKKEVSSIIQEKYDFNYSKYLRLSQKQHKEANKEKTKIKHNVAKFKRELDIEKKISGMSKEKALLLETFLVKINKLIDKKDDLLSSNEDPNRWMIIEKLKLEIKETKIQLKAALAKFNEKEKSAYKLKKEVYKTKITELKSQLNDSNHKLIYQQIKKEKTEYFNSLNLNVKSSFDLKEAANKLAKAKAENKEEIKKYIQQNIEINSKLDDEIKKENDLYLSLKAEQSEVNKLFEIKYKEALDKFREYSITIGKSKKDIKFEINKFMTMLKEKQETLESFNVEVKYLNKDIKKLNILMGINETLLSKLFKNSDLYRNIQHYLIYFIAKSKISNLLTKNKIYKALEDVGLLKQFAYRYPHEFSGGQRQRIVIARALISDPSIIVADEPIASLDISIQAQIINLLKDLCEQKNIGLIFIAHDLSMVEYIADRILIMHLGKVVESGKTNKIYENPIHPYTKNLFKAIPKISNADKKFENISFVLDYLSEQNFYNIPSVHKYDEEHFVYGTDAQFIKWTNKKR
ncbi:ATP-binding cassette domain-containing protein [Mycoplasma phocimorsus]|uniref:ATP-binding cassette domain-containing protein n=1 Tax=Mycoplasma phocimorsus TaxID=3045839 RepID=UPI0024BF24EA|nr:ATP-binding cassette domain-containing protein [Mycoplasma phocimorsus]MDJ1648370.1 ATP-binding cassette domain-containing protein [Mycoplasma phocimorsus]